MNENTMQALVVASFGNNYIVFTEHREYLEARFKGKTYKAVVGDIVDIKITAYTNKAHEIDKPQASQASIFNIHTRKNLLYRSDATKSKSFASNIDRVLLVVATEPSFNTTLIDRAIIACGIENIPLTIILNKCDVVDKLDFAREQLSIYKELSYDILELSSVNQQQEVQKLFEEYKNLNQNCLLIGQSGMGKSSLINCYMPHVKLRIQEISNKLDSGKHTTTHTKLYKFNDQTEDFRNGYIIDSPGFQLFGLRHLSNSQIMHGFKEFKPYIGKCKFHNCTHQHEPQCAILDAYNQNKISEKRLFSYWELI